jgi:hypothetical protein
MSSRLIIADVFDGLASLPDKSVDLVMSSPPFLGLRSYLPDNHPNKRNEIGLEPTPADFIDTLLDVVEACNRVLTCHGSLVFELGDTYATSKPNDGNWPLEKSLSGIPTLFAWSLAYGRNLLRPDRTTEPWRIRNVVVWCRPNPPVGFLGDKFRPATSYLIVATKTKDRWFDLDSVRTPHKDLVWANRSHIGRRNQVRAITGLSSNSSGGTSNPIGAPPLDYWEISPSPYKGSHYATYPAELCEKPIKAMCPREVCRKCRKPRRRLNESDWTDCGHDDYRLGVVLDPFAGSGTTLAVANGNGRDAIGIDIDERNVELTQQRVGMFLSVENLKES